jgi:aspartyl protease family protein
MSVSIRRAAAALPLCLCSASVFSQAPPPPDNEIVVTGEFRRTALDELPASVSVVGPEEIAARGARHLEEILALTPNVTTASGASRASAVTLASVSVNGARLENVQALVVAEGLDVSLLGMSYLGRLTRFEATRDTLRFEP